MKTKTLLFALASLSIGCSSYDLLTPTQESLAGNWNLTSVNGRPLPFVFSQTGAGKVEITQDVLTVTPPNTFTEATTVRSTRSEGATTETIFDSGTYEFNSYAVAFYFKSDGSVGSGTMRGSKMEVVTSGVTFTYTKQD